MLATTLYTMLLTRMVTGLSREDEDQDSDCDGDDDDDTELNIVRGITD